MGASTETSSSQASWWKTATVYQIWPASYKDGNGDGIGDIRGAISTLPYLRDLGIDTIWLSPVYKSPQKDFGYDISDYEDIHEPYGTLADMDLMISECHRLGMRILLDLVINHTSDQHKWFLESRSSRTNSKADWYIWKDPKVVDGERKPPNNWRSFFGGSAWEYAAERDQYYLHCFLSSQPDLNWEKEETRKAIYKTAIEFWLEKGVDGFRNDALDLYSKDTSWSDAQITFPDEEFQPAYPHLINGPRMHEWLQEQRAQAMDKYGDIFLVGEVAPLPAKDTLKYINPDARELNCIFDFSMVSCGGSFMAGFKRHQAYKPVLPEFKEACRKSQHLTRGTEAWTTVFFENHDQPRSLSQFATDDDKYRDKAAKMLATMLCCLTGTLFIYQGQEIGMVNFPNTWGIEDMRDPETIALYEEIRDRYGGDPLWLKKAMKGLQYKARDNARLPVQWDSSANAGFTTAKTPWMRVHDNYKTVNVADQQQDPDSTLNFWRKIVRVRKTHCDLMIFGEFELCDQNDLYTFTFTKMDKETGNMLYVFLNFTDEEQPISWPVAFRADQAELLVSNVHEPGLYLSPWESRVYFVPTRPFAT